VEAPRFRGRSRCIADPRDFAGKPGTVMRKRGGQDAGAAVPDLNRHHSINCHVSVAGLLGRDIVATQ
jgi:hypothetical protein